MGRIFGMAVGVIWIVFVFISFSRSAAGWNAGQTDIGFWWAVIGSLLTLAAGSAFVGTWIHTRR